MLRVCPAFKTRGQVIGTGASLQESADSEGMSDGSLVNMTDLLRTNSQLSQVGASRQPATAVREEVQGSAGSVSRRSDALHVCTSAGSLRSSCRHGQVQPPLPDVSTWSTSNCTCDVRQRQG